MRQKGGMTVFFSMVLLITVSVLLAILETARVTGAELYLKMASDSAINSLMGCYDRELWDRYHLLMLSYEAPETVLDTYEGYLVYYLDQSQFYPMTPCRTELTKLTSPAEGHPEAVAEEIDDFIKSRLPLTGQYQRRSVPQENHFSKLISEAEKSASEIIKKIPVRDILEMDQEEREKIKENADPEMVNSLTGILTCLKNSTLSLVLPEDIQISGKQADPGRLSSSVSANRNAGNSGSLLLKMPSVSRYIELSFDSFQTKEEKRDGKLHALDYEKEYLIGGHEKDADNLSAVVEKLMWIRTVLNFRYLVNSAEKRAAAVAAATLITSGTPALQTAAEYLILGLWARAEAIVDLRALLSGEKIPFLKDDITFQTSFSQLISLDFLQSKPLPCPDGQDYDTYLKILLAGVTPKDQIWRIMDLIEWNMQCTRPDFSFQMCAYEVETDVEVRQKHVFIDRESYRSKIVTGSSY